MTITIAAIYRYPVKGLSADPLESADLTVDRRIPHDRRFAIARGSASRSAGAPEWQSKAHFLQVMAVPKLASLETAYDPETTMLEIRRNNRLVARGALDSRTGCTVIEQFFAAYAKSDLRGPAKILDLGTGGFTDTEQPFISIVNRATVRDIERVVGRPVDPLRFRGNLLIDGAGAWEEADWPGRRIAIGGVELSVEEPIGRCAATNANPTTGERDMTIPHDLRRGFGHEDCGVYCRVTKPGKIAVGDTITPIG